MNRRLPLCLALCALPLVAGSYALGQKNAPPKDAPAAREVEWALRMEYAETNAEIIAREPKPGSAALDTLTARYAEAARDPALTRGTARFVALRYLQAKEGAQSAEQANQAANEASVRLQMLQVAQNARIIEQLDKLNAKK